MLKKSNQKGFSIIEVLIVLAIAGLIMLIVFLAVPALQRNARNQSRQSDGSKISAAITQCLSNNNGRYGNCQTEASIAFDADEMGQLTGASYQGTVANAESNATTDTATWIFGQKCNGSGLTDGTQREFAVLYKTEGSGEPQACIGS